MTPGLKRESGRGIDLRIINTALLKLNEGTDEPSEGQFLKEKRRPRMEC